MAMSPDGTTVVSAAADETLRLWRCFDIDPQKKAKKSATKKDSGIMTFQSIRQKEHLLCLHSFHVQYVPHVKIICSRLTDCIYCFVIWSWFCFENVVSGINAEYSNNDNFSTPDFGMINLVADDITFSVIWKYFFLKKNLGHRH